MYWYKPGRLLAVILLAAAGCKPAVKENTGGLKYFDIKKYFNAEAVRLVRQYPQITKTVIYNGRQETKAVTIKHWQQELSLFTESDINKPAWRDGYKITKNANGITYQSKDNTLRTQRIDVITKHAKIVEVRIDNITTNMLYTTRQFLDYIPDSIYSIKIQQKVRLLGANNYEIAGKFK